MDDKAERSALFRYGLVAPLVIEPLARGELTQRAGEIAHLCGGRPDFRRPFYPGGTTSSARLGYFRVAVSEV